MLPFIIQKKGSGIGKVLVILALAGMSGYILYTKLVPGTTGFKPQKGELGWAHSTITVKPSGFRPPLVELGWSHSAIIVGSSGWYSKLSELGWAHSTVMVT